MNFYIHCKSYNGYGGHTTLSPIGNFLLLGSSHFGDAIKEISIILSFKDSGPAAETLESFLERHNQDRATLPKITYRRAKANVEIRIASELMDARDWIRTPRLSLPLFERGIEEVIQALQLIKKRLKPSDDFNFEAFIRYCEAARARIPASEDLLQDLAIELKAAENAKRAALSPWELLDIDWGDFHPQARDVLDEPFYWDRTNDFSPNGNDTGADLLGSYQDWFKRNKHGAAMQFIECLAQQWGYQNLQDMDEESYHQVFIALAFAEIKLKAHCDSRIRLKALESIEYQRVEAELALTWSHRDERLTTLYKLQTKLQQLDCSIQGEQ